MMPWRLLTQVITARYVLLSEDAVVLKAAGVDAPQESQDGSIRFGAVRNKKVGILGCADVAMEDDAETTDDHVLQADGVGVGDDARQVRTEDAWGMAGLDGGNE